MIIITLGNNMEVWTVLLPILLTDAVNPVLFAFMVYAAGASRPVLLSSSMLLGHTAAYFLAGIVLALFMEAILDWFATPGTIVFSIELVLGLGLLGVALGSRKSTGKRPNEDTPNLTVPGAFVFGAVVNFIGIPFAVPYFAAIDQILKVEFTTTEAVMALLSYNLAYALPFAVVPFISAVMGDRARPVLARVNELLDKASGVLMPVMLGVIGLALLADAVAYFVTGHSLF